MYTKRARGGQSHFLPRSPKFGFVDGKMEKKCMKRKGNNVGSTTIQNKGGSALLKTENNAKNHRKQNTNNTISNSKPI